MRLRRHQATSRAGRPTPKPALLALPPRPPRGPLPTRLQPRPPLRGPAGSARAALGSSCRSGHGQGQGWRRAGHGQAQPEALHRRFDTVHPFYSPNAPMRWALLLSLILQTWKVTHRGVEKVPWISFPVCPAPTPSPKHRLHPRGEAEPTEEGWTGSQGGETG